VIKQLGIYLEKNQEDKVAEVSKCLAAVVIDISNFGNIEK
jgi:hypothetical protein